MRSGEFGVGEKASMRAGLIRGGKSLLCLTLLGLSLVLVPTASAAKGVYDTFGLPGPKGGEFWPTPASGGLEAIAVNTGGVGGANPGDLYTVETDNHRVQRFDADGNFIAAWGIDVDSAGGSGYEICTVAASCKAASASGLGGGMNDPTSIAIEQATGTVYVGDRLNRRIDVFNATGTFLRAWGQNVVESGPGNTGIGFEICVAADGDVCRAGANATTGGGFNSAEPGIGGVAVAPTGVPNAGNLLVSDRQNRVQEFTSGGAFVRAFGRDVVESGPGNTGTGFEVCNAATDTCKAGVGGPGLGQFGPPGPNGIAEDSSGNIYTVEFSANFRVQKFTLPGNVVTPQGEYLPGTLKGTSATDTPIAVAVDTATPPGTPGTLFVLKCFAPGTGIPPVASKECRILEVDPAANAGEGEVLATYMAKAGLNPESNLAGLAFNTSSKRLYATKRSNPFAYIIDEVPPPAVTLGAAEPGATTVTLKATITPAPLPKLGTLYRFEYALEGSGEWKKAPEPDKDVGNGLAPVEVSEKVEGLEINACYDLKILVYSRFFGAEEEDAGSFCTEPVAPEVKTGEALWSSPPATKPSLTLHGTVNPGKDQTDYVFQYATKEAFEASGFASAAQVPLLPAPAGRGLFDVPVLQSIPGDKLDPTKTYVYRIVATNSVGTAHGEPREVAPPDPSGRFFELVSEADSGGLGVARINAISENGQRVALSAQALGDPNSLPAQITPFLSQREGRGWGMLQVAPEPESGRAGNAFDFTAWYPVDLSTALWAHYSLSMQVQGEVSWTFTDPDGAFREALPKLVPVSGRGTVSTFFILTGGASDLSSFVFQREEASESGDATSATYLSQQPTSPPTGEPGDIYRVTGAGSALPALTLVNYDEGGNLISNACGAWVGVRNLGSPGTGAASKGLNLRPVSADGSVTYFSARPSGSTACNEAVDRIRIFKRIGDSATVEVSKSQCTRVVPTPCSTANGDDFFQGASANGNRVFFTSTRQLTDSDEDAGSDLYLFDSDPPAGQPNLVQASKGSAPAEVQEGILDAAADGSRAYFVAKGALAPGAVAGDNNLYVYERDDAHPTGRLAFVAKLDGADSTLWGASEKQAYALPFAGAGGKGPGDGHSLLFTSKAKLAGADTDAVADLYRYSDQSTSLSCLTCAANGNFPVALRNHTAFADPAHDQRNRVATEDLSRVIFASAEKLDPEDHNTVADAYEWHNGAIELVSTGFANSLGVDAGASAPTLSPDGSTAVFLTSDRILPADGNSAADAYAARLGGGFPEAGEVRPCVGAEECRTAPVVVAPPRPIVSGGAGPGNPPATKRGKCPKGKVRNKKGKCVKKKGRHGKKRASKGKKHKAGKNKNGGKP